MLWGILQLAGIILVVAGPLFIVLLLGISNDKDDV